jgi:hypothetical protein
MANIANQDFNDNDVDGWIDHQKAQRNNISDRELIRELSISLLGLYIGNVYRQNAEKIIAKLRQRQQQNPNGGKKRRKTKKSKRKTLKRK